MPVSHQPAPRAQRLGSKERSEWDQLTRLCERSKQYLSLRRERGHDAGRAASSTCPVPFLGIMTTSLGVVIASAAKQSAFNLSF